MREDKLIRRASDGIDGSILLAAKRAVLANDTPAFKAALEPVNQLAQLAATTNDSALKERCRFLIKEIGRVVAVPGCVVMETKGLAARSIQPATTDELDEIADAEPIGSIEGYGAVFGNVDLGGDTIIRGAFAASLTQWKREGRLPVMLASHDMRQFPVGSWTVMDEDAHGLRVKGVVANTPRGREVWNLITMKPSALDGLSIGYSVIDSDFDKNTGGRRLKKLDLFELSIVSLPMNTSARINAPKQLDPVSAALENCRRMISQASRIESSDNVLKFTRSPEGSEGDVLASLNRLANKLSSRG